MKAACELAHLLEPERELLGREVERLVRLLPRAPQAAEREEHRGQPLLRAVVEVALDPPPLRVRHLDETALVIGAWSAGGARNVPLGAVVPQAGLRQAQRERERDETLLRAVVEVALEPPSLFVAGRDDACARGLELGLLPLPLRDLADDHQELVLTARREARLVAAHVA